MHILLIEDDKQLSKIIQKGLIEEKYVVDAAFDGEKGEYLASVYQYDAIILDIRLPKIDGYTVCSMLRKNKNNTPILMLTSNDMIEQKIKGLDLGADDYLTKPFDFNELLARIRALIRRKYLQSETTVLSARDLTLNTVNHQAKRGNESIELTSLEYRLLHFFMMNSNRVLSRTVIIEHVWDINFDLDSNIVDVYVNYLRNKIDKDCDIKLIHTIRGSGYIFKTKDEN
ncbi:response regulator transcription factor [Candidatus Dependentiae bacterium]|mgnify:CR=1 FL=1|nr:response regulator transcription factor [Candidatus Dependentiae bacterium]